MEDFKNIASKKLIMIAAGILLVGVLVYLAAIGSLTGGTYTPPSSQSAPKNPVEGGIKTLEGTVVATGASPVTDKGKVIAPSGDEAKTDVEPGSREAPQTSVPLNEVPPKAVHLTMKVGGITLSSFTVKPGEVVTLAVTAGDDQTHVLKFKDPLLKAVAVGVGPGETRAITFNAPNKAGEYQFTCDVHLARGEDGVMVVK